MYFAVTASQMLPLRPVKYEVLTADYAVTQSDAVDLWCGQNFASCSRLQSDRENLAMTRPEMNSETRFGMCFDF